MDATRPIYTPISDSTGTHDGDLRAPDLVGLVRRHWWVLALFLIAGVAGAWKFTQLQEKVYEASTAVLVQPTGSGQDTNVVGGRTRGELNLDTEAQLVRSTPVAVVAAELLRSPLAPDDLARRVAVKVPANTSVLVISYSAGTAQAAQAGSHAFAEAYLRSREDTDRAELTARAAAIEAKVRQLGTVLAEVNARIVTLRPDTSDRANLESQRQTTVSQLNSLNSQFNQVSTTAPNAGRIIRDAGVPAAPVKPSRLLNLASGAMLGLLLGVLAGYVRERLDKRVRRALDLPRRADVAVLASLPPRVRPPVDDTFPPFGTGGRLFNRLRNEILASIPAPPLVSHTRSLPHGQMVVVAGVTRSVTRGGASTLVAANLAVAFARTGADTVLVCAHRPENRLDAGPMTRLFGVRATPGLADVLAGRADLTAATQQVREHPHLRVLTTGAVPNPESLLQSQALRETLTAVRGRAAYVVVEAPSTATSADAQSLAAMADAVVLAVELRRTRYSDVIDAAEQLRRVGTALLGAVVVARLGNQRVGRRPAPAPATATDPDGPDGPDGVDGVDGVDRHADERLIELDADGRDVVWALGDRDDREPDPAAQPGGVRAPSQGRPPHRGARLVESGERGTETLLATRAAIPDAAVRPRAERPVGALAEPADSGQDEGGGR